MVYIIKEGEFEITKRFKRSEVKKDFDMSKLLNLQSRDYNSVL